MKFFYYFSVVFKKREILIDFAPQNFNNAKSAPHRRDRVWAECVVAKQFFLERAIYPRVKDTDGISWHRIENTKQGELTAKHRAKLSISFALSLHISHANRSVSRVLIAE